MMARFKELQGKQSSPPCILRGERRRPRLGPSAFELLIGRPVHLKQVLESALGRFSRLGLSLARVQPVAASTFTVHEEGELLNDRRRNRYWLCYR